MGRATGEDMRVLLAHSMLAIPMLQTNLAELLGVSSRTMRRWISGGVTLLPSQLVTLASAVHAKDPALAARIAAHHGTTLEELGIVRPPPPRPATPQRPARDPVADRLLADALLCCAAEVADVSPRVMRPALAAVLQRAREAGLTLDAVHALFTDTATSARGKA